MEWWRPFFRHSRDATTNTIDDTDSHYRWSSNHRVTNTDGIKWGMFEPRVVGTTINLEDPDGGFDTDVINIPKYTNWVSNTRVVVVVVVTRRNRRMPPHRHHIRIVNSKGGVIFVTGTRRKNHHVASHRRTSSSATR